LALALVKLILSFCIYRQKTLEDALLHSGQFKEALQAVLDWLYKVTPQLGEDQLVHGDTDTVASLKEEHRVSTKNYTLHRVSTTTQGALNKA